MSDFGDDDWSGRCGRAGGDSGGVGGGLAEAILDGAEGPPLTVRSWALFVFVNGVGES